MVGLKVVSSGISPPMDEALLLEVNKDSASSIQTHLPYSGCGAPALRPQKKKNDPPLYRTSHPIRNANSHLSITKVDSNLPKIRNVCYDNIYPQLFL